MRRSATVLDRIFSVLFIALFLLVVRNTSVNHFIRFNVLQAILLSILLSVCLMILGIPGIGGNNILGATLTNVIFFASTTVIIYAMVRSALGKYAELPVISETVYPQLL